MKRLNRFLNKSLVRVSRWKDKGVLKVMDSFLSATKYLRDKTPEGSYSRAFMDGAVIGSEEQYTENIREAEALYKFYEKYEDRFFVQLWGSRDVILTIIDLIKTDGDLMSEADLLEAAANR